MKYLLCLLLIAAISSAEVLWSWDFDVIPNGWEANQYWDFADTVAHSYVQSSSGSESQTSEMYSDTLTIPPDVCMITAYLYSEHNYDGWYSTGESSCSLWARLGIAGGSMHTLEFESHSWGFDSSAAGTGIMSAVVEVPVNGGDNIYLTFVSHAGSSYSASAMMDWTISALTITSGSATLLRHSWAEIKNSFQ
ncbi:MAG: hypothetical protein J7K88_05255 [Candidatus Fermentibacteraceae bacterium]|nr:hypothetical protein [Candidatus Fermentibacteraceae bacterium]